MIHQSQPICVFVKSTNEATTKNIAVIWTLASDSKINTAFVTICSERQKADSGKTCN